MKTMVELRTELCGLFSDIKNNVIDPKRAKEMTNVAGKIISSVIVQLKGHELNKEKHNIAFLK